MADLELQLRLSADGSGLVGTLRSATGEVRQFRTESEKANEVSAASADKIGRATAAYDVLFDTVSQVVSGFTRLIKSEIDYADQVGTTAQRLGVSVEALSALGAAARRNSSDFDGVTSGLDSLGESAVRAGTKGSAGARQYSAAFAALSVDVLDASGNIKPTVALFEEVARALAKLPDGAIKARLANQLLGSSGAELNGTLDELAKSGLQGVIDKAREAGDVITNEAAARAKEFKDGLQELNTKAATFAQSVGQAVLPTLLALAGMFTDTAEGEKKAANESSTLRSFMEGLGRTVIIVQQGLTGFFTILYGGIDILIGVTKAAARTVEGLGYAAQAVVAFNTGQLGVASDFADKAKGTFSAGWKEIETSATRAWNNITSAGAEAGAKIDEYDKRIADGYKTIGAAATESGDAADAANGVARIALEKYLSGLKNVDRIERERAKAQRELVAATSAQGTAIGRLADKTSALAGVTDPLTAEWEHHAAVLRDIGGDGAHAIEAYEKAVEAAAKAHVPLNTNLLTTAQVQDLVAAAIIKANAAHQAKLATIERERDVTGETLKALTTEAKLIGLTTTQARIESTVLRALAEAKRKNLEAGVDLIKVDEERIRQQATLNEALEVAAQVNVESPFAKMVSDIELMKEALEAVADPLNEAFDPTRAKELQLAIKQTQIQLATQFVGAAREGLQSLQSMTKEGGRSFQALQIAIDATTIAEGILAVVHQLSTGDVYTAIPRAIAVAAAIASLGVSIGNFASGGFSDTAAQRQATQGTGSVLGDSEAQSESIANGVEITANATSQLVALNRGMLNALNTLVAGLGSAANMLARGAGQADFSGMNLAVAQAYPLGAPGSIVDPLGFLGGSSKITDEGIIIFGGALTAMLDSIAVGAYQEVQSRSWAFGSTHTNEGISAVSDEFATQFQLIIGSIIDTVREGALALGLVPEEVQAALDAFAVEEIRISLQGLSAEEQQQALQAVFSELFDGLAGSVVPFVAQFQQVGEGLGETLIRIATEVQVAHEAFSQLGLAVDEVDPERFAQISDGLIQAAGGLDSFISGMQSFVANFAPDSHKLEVASEAITSALEQVGLAVPATRDGMWELMQSLDATTEAGQEQIATLLRLADVSDQYYQLLDNQVSKASEYLDSLGLGTSTMSDFVRELLVITESGNQAVEAANTIAVAQGREGASAIQLARIHQWTADQIAAAARRLQQQTQDLIAKLYGGIPGSLDAINARISELEGISGGLASGIGDIQDASASLFEAWASGIQTVQDYLDSMLLGDLSALSPEEQLAEAQRQLIAMQAAAVGGDANALAQLPQLADAFLRLLQGSGASGADYQAGFQWVRDLLGSVVDLQNPGSAAAPAPVELVPSAELVALYAARDAAEAAANAEQRAEWARQLTQSLADWSTIMRVPTLEFIEAQGVSLTNLAEDLGVDFDNVGAQSVSALGFLASTLGVSMTDLTASLSLSLADLAPGLTELTAGVGIDLAALTAGTTQTLAALAGSLGLNLDEISTALDINLGALTDSQSLISQALSSELGSLPEDQRTALEPLFDAIADATSEADANAAISALEDAVNLIGGETANALAPYLEGVFPVSALDQLDYLGEIQDIAAQQLDQLGLINSNLRASNIGAGVPSYAVGTGFVQGDQLAMIHHGEAVVPAPVNTFLKTAGWPLGGSANDDRIIVELRRNREGLKSLERTIADGHNKIAGTVADGDYKARLQRDDLDRRKADVARSPAR